MVATYREVLSIPKVGEMLHLAPSTIHRILLRNNVERVGRTKYLEEASAIRMEQAQEIRCKYEQGQWIAALSREYDVQPDAIRSAIKRAGGTLRPVSMPLSSQEEEKILALHAEGFSTQAISRETDRANCSVDRILRRHGLNAHGQVRENHHNWKGGEWIDDAGYRRVLVSVEDRHLTDDRYVREHRLIMARSLGRPLEYYEEVHHKNGNRLDNHIDNLELRTKPHGAGVRLLCFDCGSHNVGEIGLSKEEET